MDKLIITVVAMKLTDGSSVWNIYLADSRTRYEAGDDLELQAATQSDALSFAQRFKDLVEETCLQTVEVVEV